jgi:hypothetical protein
MEQLNTFLRVVKMLKGVCKLDDLSPYGYNFSICRKELMTPLYCKKITQNPNLFEN